METRAKSIVIVGAGGLGKEILEILRYQNKIYQTWNIVGFADEDEELCGAVINDCPVLGGLDYFREHIDENIGYVCAISVCEAKKRVVEKLREMGAKCHNVIHPPSVLSELIELGEGVVVFPGAILTVNIKIGDHVLIHTNVGIGHDTVIGNYCTINPSAQIAGENHLGEGVYIGIGAISVPSISIGGWTTVGAGGVVLSDLPERVVAVGMPVRVIKEKQY